MIRYKGVVVVGTSDFICAMAADSLIVCFTNLGFLSGRDEERIPRW